MVWQVINPTPQIKQYDELVLEPYSSVRVVSLSQAALDDPSITVIPVDAPSIEEAKIESALQTFGIVANDNETAIGVAQVADSEGGGEPEPEGEVESVDFTPASGTQVIAEGGSFVWNAGIQGQDYGYLEIDILIDNPPSELDTKEQFNLYAEGNVYGDDEQKFIDKGVTAVFKGYENGGFEVDFGAALTELFAQADEVKIYAAVRGKNGEKIWGDMDNTTPDMTSTYVFEIDSGEGG